MFICFLDIIYCLCRFYSLPSNSPGESLCKNWSIWEILCNRKTLCHGPLIRFCLLTILQNGVNIWPKKKKQQKKTTQSKKQNPKLISLQLNQPHFNQSLLQMSVDCFPNPEPHFMKKDHHHRRYWKVCAIDSKNHFKSRILKIFRAITIGLNWKSNPLRGDTEGNSTYLVYRLSQYMTWSHCVFKSALLWKQTWGSTTLSNNNEDRIFAQDSYQWAWNSKTPGRQYVKISPSVAEQDPVVPSWSRPLPTVCDLLSVKQLQPRRSFQVPKSKFNHRGTERKENSQARQ